MAIRFNPLTGNFDFTGSGGGGGSSYIDGEAQNFSALPETLGTPAVDSAYLVREAEGTWLLARKPAGIYIRTANTGVRAADWTHAGAFPDVFNDANFLLYDNGDSSKNLAFQLSGIATGTTRTITMPNANVTLPNQGTSTTDNVTFNEVTTDNNLNVGGDLIIGNAITVGVNGVIFENAPSENTSLTTLATASRFVSLPDASGTIALTSDFAAPPAIGNTTPAAISGTTGTFTTLTATGAAELVNGASAAGPFSIYRTFTDASNYERGFIRWISGVLSFGTERLGGSGNIDVAFRRMGETMLRLANSGLNCDTAFTVNNNQPIVINGGFIKLQPFNGGSEAILARDAANILAMRNGATGQTFRLYNTTDAGLANFERGFLRWNSNVLQIGTEKLGTGTARALEFQTDGVTRMTIASTGAVSTAGNLTVGFATITTGGGSAPFWNCNNQVKIQQGEGLVLSSTQVINFYGSTFWHTGAADTQMRRASAGLLEINNGTAGQYRDLIVRNLVTDTTTGTKIGTATTQKIGFFDATPVVQQAAVADATDAASTQARLNDLLARLRTLGLIAT